MQSGTKQLVVVVGGVTRACSTVNWSKGELIGVGIISWAWFMEIMVSDELKAVFRSDRGAVVVEAWKHGSRTSSGVLKTIMHRIWDVKQCPWHVQEMFPITCNRQRWFLLPLHKAVFIDLKDQQAKGPPIIPFEITVEWQWAGRTLAGGTAYNSAWKKQCVWDDSTECNLRGCKSDNQLARQGEVKFSASKLIRVAILYNFTNTRACQL